MKIKGFGRAMRGPVYNHDCDKCSYLYTIFINTDDGEKCVDIYRQCGPLDSDSTYLFRFSSEPEDYSSGYSKHELIQLVAVYFILRKEKRA